MTFLELVQRTARESGIEGTIASCQNQVGMYAKLVYWVADAWSELQGDKPWLFMRTQGSFSLAVGRTDYSISDDFSITNLKEWATPKLYATDASGSYTIKILDYDEFRTMTLGQTVNAQRPSYCAVAPSYRMVFDAAPTEVATVVNDYWQTAQVLTNDKDEPNMNEDYHLAIVWKALRDYAEHEESPEMQRRARRKFMNLYQKMCITELPSFSIGAHPLAWGRSDP